MNLTDGKVLCGRRYFDGSGGNNHALLHFQETRYPLAVKLGTITPDGAGEDKITFVCMQTVRLDVFKLYLHEAWPWPKLGVRLSLPACILVPSDVYSYDEDDMVLDSKLPEHLAHFGIDMMTMEKARALFGPFLFLQTH